MAKPKPKVGLPATAPATTPAMDDFIKGGRGEAAARAEAKPAKGPTKRISVDLDLETYDKIRDQAHEKRMKMTQLIRSWIDENC